MTSAAAEPHKTEQSQLITPGDRTDRANRPEAHERAIFAEPRGREGPSLQSASIGELLGRITELSTNLARSEVELARVEARLNFDREKRSFGTIGAAALIGFLGVQLLLVAAVFAFYEGHVLAGWLAALFGAALLFLVAGAAGLAGWASRVRVPLQTTRTNIQRTAQWAKHRIKAPRAT